MAFSKALPFVAMLIVVLPMVAMADIDGNMTTFYGTQLSLSLSLSYTHIDTQTKIKSCIYDFFFVNYREAVSRSGLWKGNMRRKHIIPIELHVPMSDWMEANSI
jgi:hypothetical protein